MWSPFTRKASKRKQRNAEPQLEMPWEMVSNPIATIDHVGPTAIATLTVTALSTKEGVAMLMNLFNQVSHSGAESLVLDIQNLEYMDSVCLGCLIKALNCAVQDGGRIALVNVEGNVQQMMRVTQLDRRFPICQNVPKALEAIDRLS